MSTTIVGFEDGVVGQKYEIDEPANGSANVSAMIGSEHPSHGAKSLKIDPAGSYQYVQWNFDDTPQIEGVTGFGFYTATLPPAGQVLDIWRLFKGIASAASTDRVKVEWIGSAGVGKFRLTDSAGATVTTANAYAAATYHRAAVRYKCATAAGGPLLSMTIYTGKDSTTAVETVSITSPTLPAYFDNRRLGKQTTGATTIPLLWLDDWAVGTDADTDWPLAPGTDVTAKPTANAGTDIAGVQAGSVVALNATLTSGADTITWTLLSNTSATTPTLDNPNIATPKYTAPADWHAGSKQVWRLTATNAAGSTFADVTVSVAPVAMAMIRKVGSTITTKAIRMTVGRS